MDGRAILLRSIVDKRGSRDGHRAHMQPDRTALPPPARYHPVCIPNLTLSLILNELGIEDLRVAVGASAGVQCPAGPRPVRDKF